MINDERSQARTGHMVRTLPHRRRRSCCARRTSSGADIPVTDEPRRASPPTMASLRGSWMDRGPGAGWQCFVPFYDRRCGQCSWN